MTHGDGDDIKNSELIEGQAETDERLAELLLMKILYGACVAYSLFTRSAFRSLNQIVVIITHYTRIFIVSCIFKGSSHFTTEGVQFVFLFIFAKRVQQLSLTLTSSRKVFEL